MVNCASGDRCRCECRFATSDSKPFVSCQFALQLTSNRFLISTGRRPLLLLCCWVLIRNLRRKADRWSIFDTARSCREYGQDTPASVEYHSSARTIFLSRDRGRTRASKMRCLVTTGQKFRSHNRQPLDRRFAEQRKTAQAASFRNWVDLWSPQHGILADRKLIEVEPETEKTPPKRVHSHPPLDGTDEDLEAWAESLLDDTLGPFSDSRESFS